MDNSYIIHILDGELPQDYVILTHGRIFTTCARRATLFKPQDLTDDRLMKFLEGRKYELKKVKYRRDRERL